MTTRILFLSHILGVPSGDGRTTVTFLEGEVAEITETQYESIRWLRTRTNEPLCVEVRIATTETCVPCGKQFKTGFLEDHRELFHAKNRERYVCFDNESCGRSFPTEKGLHVHQSRNRHGKYRYAERRKTR